MIKNKSVATIDKPEFINIVPYNPLISTCEIKVLYVGENRNHTYMDKETIIKMANSLPGSPIVGYFKENKNDFGDHGEKVTIEGGEVKFECMTQPYGFVAPNAKVWFQKFVDTDEFGNELEREYLMTTGYLWTGQYEEAQKILDDGGKPHSMELDKNSYQGHWAENVNTGMEFFIINDAIFSKLCVLGDDVEPCFEGSSITAPKISSSFTLDDDFKTTLFSMMNELKYALEGGNKMAENVNEVIEETAQQEESASTEFVKEEDKDKEEKTSSNETDNTTEDKKDEEKEEDKKDKKSEYVKSDDEEEKKDDSKSEEDKEDEEKSDDKEDKKDKKYSLLEADYNELQSKYSALEAEANELRTFKLGVEKGQKEDLIQNSFYMLSEEDTKNVRENIDKYTLDEIEKELAVICVRKKVNFSLEDSAENDNKKEEEILTYNVNNEDSSLPAWVKAVKENQ